MYNFNGIEYKDAKEYNTAYLNYKHAISCDRNLRKIFAKNNFVKNPSNAIFTKTDIKFMEACQQAGIVATVRQASKYRRKCGAAYNMRNK